jgi:predicted DNA-binding transcriptional regulator AlpA
MDAADLLDRDAVADLLHIQPASVSRMLTPSGTRLVPGFPQPVMRMGRSPVWLRADIDEWRARRARVQSRPHRFVERIHDPAGRGVRMMGHPCVCGRAEGDGLHEVPATGPARDGHPALRCTACGGEITPRLEYRSGSYSEHRDHEGYDCDDCPAAWDQRGNPEPARW